MGAVHKAMVYLGFSEDDEYPPYPVGEDEDETASVTRLHDPSRTRSVRGPSAVPPALRPAGDLSRIHTIKPRSYNDARVVGEAFREGIPVIMTLTEMSDADAKRLVDFSAGLSFGLHGTLERVASSVFLLSPAHVEIGVDSEPSAAERGFFNQS
jgi:cell division inhibitor SepF